MQKCTLLHTGVYQSAEGVIKNNKVYLKEEEDKLLPPEEMFLSREECEDGLIQFMVEGKWGFANISTGEIIIDPVQDYLGPFYHGYSHAVLDAEIMINNGMLLVEIEGGKHGYIGTDGKVIISIEYDAAAEIPYRKTYFKLAKNGKYGIVDQYNEIKIPFKYDYLETSYDHDLVFCVIKEKQKMLENWAVYDQDFNLIIDAELDEQAINLENYKTKNTLGRLNPKYYLLGLLRSKIIQSDRY